MKKSIITLLAISAATLSPIEAEINVLKNSEATQVKQKQAVLTNKKVEICFVLDTTGSMSGLIQGAKRKIWTIANHIVQNQNAPEVRFSLIAYRDIGDAYVTQITPLTDDLDAIQQTLNTFQAQGGGDHPESVNQALFESIQKIKWSDDKAVSKIVFLVGDAPPHMDYKQDVPYHTTCEGAKSKGIIINTIQCGSNSSTTQVWAKIAMLANGQFASIAQSGGAQAVSCPQDDKLAELGQKLNQTVIPYGSIKKRQQVARKMNSVNKLSNESQAARSCYNWHQKESKAITGNEDLIVEIENSRITVGSIKRDFLEESLRGLSKPQLQKIITEKIRQRKEIQLQIKTLSKQRANYLSELSVKKGGAKSNAFDKKMKGMLDQQIQSK